MQIVCHSVPYYMLGIFECLWDVLINMLKSWSAPEAQPDARDLTWSLSFCYTNYTAFLVRKKRPRPESTGALSVCLFRWPRLISTGFCSPKLSNVFISNHRKIENKIHHPECFLLFVANATLSRGSYWWLTGWGLFYRVLQYSTHPLVEGGSSLLDLYNR